ncbi:MAG TPA: glycogen debranching N-terminal domain-containing protein [Candidatus Binatia bacterium]|nr:glycogen debranching N-terminal domain-containing protein [Candidatus Binatia bacterium]
MGDAARRRGRHAGLGPTQARSKARILTQPEPAKVERTAEAVVLKEGSLFLLADEHGDVPWALPHGFGLFFHDCRFLDGYTLRLEGRPLTLLSALGGRGFETDHYLTNPELTTEDRRPIPRNTITVRRHRVVRGDVIHEQLEVTSFAPVAVSLRLQLAFRAGFEDLFIVKGFVKGPRGRRRPARITEDGALELGYDGRDGRVRTTTIAFVPPPDHREPARATWRVSLRPGRATTLSLTITPAESAGVTAERGTASPATPAETLRRWHRKAERIWSERSAKVESSSLLFDRVLGRALADLRILRSRLDGLDYFAAGIPWFATLFGRDAAVVALQTLPYGTDAARQTLRLLARYQASERDAYRDAEPGKILHELRSGELARLGAIPQSLAYYGTVDATPLFLILLAEYVRWSGDLDLASRLRPHVDAALGWMAGPADSDGDGYLDYSGRFGDRLVNQGWKDSGNCIVNADGSSCEPPIALAEVQGYAYRAWYQTAALLRALGDEAAAGALERRAAEVRARFDLDFWDEALGCYVLARQAGGRPAAVVTSNAGQVLWGGIAEPARAAAVAARLMQPDMFSGWGIRTLSSEARAFNPVSYHLGSVWPHDNALILAGFRRYGHDVPARRVFDAVFDAAAAFRHYRLPERLEWLALRRLRVGDADVDLRLTRVAPDGRCEAEVTRREGDLMVQVSDATPAFAVPEASAPA